MTRFSLALLLLGLVACDEPVLASSDVEFTADASTTDVPERRDVLADSAAPDASAPDVTDDVFAPDVTEDAPVEDAPEDVAVDDATTDSGDLDTADAPSPDVEADTPADSSEDTDTVPDALLCFDICEISARCVGDVVETCSLDVRGCLVWSRSIDCSVEGTFCVDREDGADCTVPGCDDVVMNAEETDTDCGGPECLPCDDGLGCLLASDCISSVCGPDSLCAAPECGDGVVNGAEVCDDGNEVEDDGCTNLCEPNGCTDCELTFEPPVASRLSGNASGGSRFDDNCPAGEVLIGANARVSGYVTQVQAVCGVPLVTSGPDGDVLRITEGTTLPFRGINPGSEQSTRCLPDHAVVGFGGRAGLLVDRIEFACAPWSVLSTAEGYELVQGPSVPAPALGGTGGSAVSPFRCGPSEFAVGAVIRAGDGIDAFGISCAGAAVSE
ncbi:MAG: cysteine-rich repeat protein [Bradymonadia bacterium]|jgi:cysteine-rich repeat protein